MMNDDKKKGLGVLIAIGHPKAGGSENEDGGEQAAQELLDAIESKDAGAVYEAFSNLCDICQKEEESPEPEAIAE
jgi:hypothetical protein